jgi:N-acetyl-1-D-myo-inositol-2-amino-2-deoxy-alpha-D-glucopyranoside deacetylase
VPELEHLGWEQDDALAEHRRGELSEAMDALGVTDHRFLGGFGRYSDSGMDWHEDGYAIAGPDRPENAFWDADLTEAATLLVEVIREVRPQVMSTYDQFGNYGHPDHIQAHRVATYAADLAAVPSYRRDLGEPWEVSKIYWQAMAESRWRRSLRAIRAAGDTTAFRGMDPDGPLPMATPDADLAAEIDGSAYADRKVAALHAHHTQIRVDGPFFALAHNEGNEVLGIESFRIAKGTPAPGPDGLESDLFAGL